MIQKVVIVTAASRGMGEAISRILAESGHQLALMSTSNDVLVLAKELGAAAIQGSVTSTSDLDRLVEMTLNSYGRIDGVVNNTGHPPKGDLLELSREDWMNGMDMVLLNVHHLAQRVVPHMRKDGGTIVNISSFAAFEPSLKFPISSVLRAALANYTKLFTKRYGSNNIRMNSVLPGYIDSYTIAESVRDDIPLHRSGKVEEVAQLVKFLVSEESSYIVGENIKIDGGLSNSIT